MARTTQRQTCRNHRPFLSAGEAWAHYVAQLVANATDPGQTVYLCSACRRWHHGGGIRSLGRLLAESGWEDRRAVD